MMRKIPFIVLLLILSTAVYPQVPPTNCSASDIRTFWDLRFDGWIDICLIGMILSLFIMSAIYMLASILGNPGLIAWCKKEIFQVAVTGLMLACIIGFVNFSCTTIKPSLLVNLDVDGDGIDDHPDDLFLYSIEYVQWLRDAAYKSYVTLSFLNAAITGIAMTYVRSSPGGFGIDLRPLQGLSAIGGLISFSMNSLFVGGIFTSIAHLRLVRTIQVMMFNMLLPVGLVCRCFEPTRSFGGSLMAIAIGFFLIYPILLIINAGVVEENLITQANIDNAMNSAGAWNYQNELSLDTNYNRYVDAQNPNYLNPLGGPGHAEMTSYTTLFRMFYDLVLYILIATLFLPLFNFIIVITFVRNLSQVLGEEIDVTHLTRMI